LLAGGKSSRMGYPKGLLSFMGKLWLNQQLDWISKVGIKEVCLVIGFDIDIYMEKIPWIVEGAAKKGFARHLSGLNVQVIVNRQPELGSFSSLRCGILSILESFPKKGVFILPIDIPCPKKIVWEQLVRKIEEDNLTVVSPRFNSKGGHPVVMSYSFLEALVRIPVIGENSRLDKQIYTEPNKGTVDVNDFRVGLNLNNPEQWESFNHFFSGNCSII